MKQGEIRRLQDLGLGRETAPVLMGAANQTLTQGGNTQAARSRLVEAMQEGTPPMSGWWTGLDVRAWNDSRAVPPLCGGKVEPFCADGTSRMRLITMEIIKRSLREMGLLALTIPRIRRAGLVQAALCVVSESFRALYRC